MSYDVYLVGEESTVACICRACDNEHQTVTRDALFSTNHTSNTAQMWRVAGADIAAFHLARASALGTALDQAIGVIEGDRERFRQYEPGNGWGSVESTLDFMREIRDACREYPDAMVEVSR